jgi:hypothetical protein
MAGLGRVVCDAAPADAEAFRAWWDRGQGRRAFAADVPVWVRRPDHDIALARRPVGVLDGSQPCSYPGLNGLVLDPGQQLGLIEQYGGAEALGGRTTPPPGHAGNTPFQWGKQTSSHLGGTGTR